MDASAFTAILAALVRRLPGAFAAALVDVQGETVDYAGDVDPFDVKVAAAHMRILLNDVDRLGALGKPRSLVIRGAKRSIVTRALPEQYALVILLRRRAGFTASQRAFATCERALAAEAGWAVTPVKGAPIWHPIVVESDRRGRPRWMGEPRLAVEVLGAVMGLPSNEQGFRVRTSTGSELTLVRESRRCWYTDLLPDHLVPENASHDA
ncbi:hypothetical protein AKJ09_03850 [Labilithrix luteola]|uniref:Uncharacterized protein n=1 Tax=Labilithrix luteola TaxID=1391654 RepID=A0A0K1PUY3_9BACT|nr:hypothetical protein [Labilithrix luteola]AKU97186.1 hypothetical protein AKJ09_03850 [Labilithrix luteola]